MNKTNNKIIINNDAYSDNELDAINTKCYNTGNKSSLKIKKKEIKTKNIEWFNYNNNSYRFDSFFMIYSYLIYLFFKNINPYEFIESILFINNICNKIKISNSNVIFIK